jgi:hypothetical protein
MTVDKAGKTRRLSAEAPHPFQTRSAKKTRGAAGGPRKDIQGASYAETNGIPEEMPVPQHPDFLAWNPETHKNEARARGDDLRLRPEPSFLALNRIAIKGPTDPGTRIALANIPRRLLDNLFATPEKKVGTLIRTEESRDKINARDTRDFCSLHQPQSGLNAHPIAKPEAGTENGFSEKTITFKEAIGFRINRDDVAGRELGNKRERARKIQRVNRDSEEINLPL